MTNFFFFWVALSKRKNWIQFAKVFMKINKMLRHIGSESFTEEYGVKFPKDEVYSANSFETRREHVAKLSIELLQLGNTKRNAFSPHFWQVAITARNF